MGRGLSYEQLQEVNNIIVGSPETVTRKLTEVIDGLSPGYILLYGNEGAMKHKDVMRSIELLGRRSNSCVAAGPATTLRDGFLEILSVRKGLGCMRHFELHAAKPF